jgi:hypothetical protein
MTSLTIDVDVSDLQEQLQYLQQLLHDLRIRGETPSPVRLQAFADLQRLIEEQRQCFLFTDATGKSHLEPSLELLDVIGRLKRG